MVNVQSLLEQLRLAASNVGAIVVDDFIRATDQSSPTEFLISAETALSLIEAGKPAVLYISSEVLDYGNLIVETIEEICAEDDEVTINAIQAAARPLKAHDGETSRFVAHFFVGPALHTVIMSADWLSKFEETIEQIVICPLQSGPKSIVFWTLKERLNAEEEAQAGGDYRQTA